MKDFAKLVDQDVRSQVTEEEAKILSDDKQLWRDELVSMLTDINAQLTLRNSSVLSEDDRKEFLVWKSKAVRFKSHVEDRLRDVKAMLKEENKSNDKTGYHQRLLEEVQKTNIILSEINDTIKELKSSKQILGGRV